MGLVVLAVILWHSVAGTSEQFAGLFTLFALLQVLLSLLTIRIEDDDLWLARYAPLSLVGYKQFLDLVLLKGILDVCRRDDLPWTGPTRIRQREDQEQPTDD